ncbi:hypothetical protein WJU23_02615 [Prosthecobacter sp. SYSU 5D2]
MMKFNICGFGRPAIYCPLNKGMVTPWYPHGMDQQRAHVPDGTFQLAQSQRRGDETSGMLPPGMRRMKIFKGYEILFFIILITAGEVQPATGGVL